MLAISLGVYEKAINAITNFFSDIKNNLKFLGLLGIGIVLSIILGSKIVIYLFNNYYSVTLAFFLGLIISSIIDYGKKLTYNLKNILIILGVILIFLTISFNNNLDSYQLTNTYKDTLMFFLGGIIEIISSIIPGISGTALLMNIGLYQEVLNLFSNIYNFNYILNNFNLYFGYGLGMGLSFIFITSLINYLFKHHLKITELLIMGFSLSSLILLFKMFNFTNITLIEIILSIIFLILGIFIGNKRW